MTAIIICNGTISDYSCYKRYLDRADFVICADGGAVHAKRFGIRPDILLGDFDSVPEEVFRFFKDAGVEILKFPAKKDMTDTQLAVELALDKGYRNIIILGGLGTRWDHSLSNILLLKMILDRGGRGIIANEQNEITLIRDEIRLVREKDTRISLLPLTEKVEGVTTQGMYYPLTDATLEMGSSWGVSNEFAEDNAGVTIREGLLLVILSRD